MIQTKQIGKLTEISSTEGYLHKINSEVYFKKGIMLSSETLYMYEEVVEIPSFTKEQYDTKVAELIREKYSADEEFAIQRKMINSINEETNDKTVEDYTAYNTFVEECKLKAKDPELYKQD